MLSLQPMPLPASCGCTISPTSQRGASGEWTLAGDIEIGGGTASGHGRSKSNHMTRVGVSDLNAIC